MMKKIFLIGIIGMMMLLVPLVSANDNNDLFQLTILQNLPQFTHGSNNASADQRQGIITGDVEIINTSAPVPPSYLFFDGASDMINYSNRDGFFETMRNGTVCFGANATSGNDEPQVVFSFDNDPNDIGDIRMGFTFDDRTPDRQITVSFAEELSPSILFNGVVDQAYGSHFQRHCMMINATSNVFIVSYYLNGTHIGTSGSDTFSGGINQDLAIGAQHRGLGGITDYEGGVDDFTIYNKSLTGVQLKLDFDLFKNGTILQEVPDLEFPTFGSASINNSNPRINEVVALSQVVIDDLGLDEVRLFHNQSGSFVNQTPITTSENSLNATFNLTITVPRDSVISFGWHVSDLAGKVNITEITSFTVENTPPPSSATILFPIASPTNLQPMDINVTFPVDADGDLLNINYYINGTLNQSSFTNVTFNASDNVYELSVELNDGVVSTANTTVIFLLDTTNPVIARNLPLNNSLHTANIPVDISCSDVNPFLLNYTLFNSTGQVERSVQQNESVGNVLTITDTIPIQNITVGDFTMNISCSDTHTKKEIIDYSPVKDLGNLKLTYTTENNDNIGIKIKSTTATLDDFGTYKDFDRYVFWFNFQEPQTDIIYEYVFKIDNKENLKYLPESTFKGHFVTNNNWIDFEFDDNDDAEYTIKQTKDNKYEVKIKTVKTELTFRSIGGLNIVTETLNIEIGTPPTDVDNFTSIFTSAIPIIAILMLLMVFIVLVVATFKGKFKEVFK